MTLCLFLICDGGHPCRVQNCREWEGGGFLCYVQSLAYLFTMLGNHPVTLLLLLFLFFPHKLHRTQIPPTFYSGHNSWYLFFIFFLCPVCVRVFVSFGPFICVRWPFPPHLFMQENCVISSDSRLQFQNKRAWNKHPHPTVLKTNHFSVRGWNIRREKNMRINVGWWIKGDHKNLRKKK